MSLPGLGGPVGDSLGSSLTGRLSSWSSLSLKPVSSGGSPLYSRPWFPRVTPSSRMSVLHGGPQRQT
ncbi:hypothetical protein KUCAC02_017077 [Chaenocephalus aceratus]|nr:hypothetical protein KUCAC02_017077 [Chaenocephalus aceratus]